jgi:hypothetical protein
MMINFIIKFCEVMELQALMFVYTMSTNNRLLIHLVAFPRFLHDLLSR